MKRWGEQQNAHGKITKPMKIFYQNLKLTESQRKFKLTEIHGYSLWQMNGERPSHLIMKYRPCGKRSQGQCLKGLKLIMGPEQVMRPKTLQGKWSWLRMNGALTPWWLKIRMNGAAHTFAACKTILPLPFTATTARLHGANPRVGSLWWYLHHNCVLQWQFHVNSKYGVKFEVLGTMLMKVLIFWDVTSCQLVSSYQHVPIRHIQ